MGKPFRVRDMNVLIDTVAFIWLTKDPQLLSKKALSLCKDPTNVIFLSSVSAAELSIKHQLGRFPLPATPSIFIPQQRHLYGVQSLALEESAVILLESLPHLHKDPFDRLLICQALAHDLTILTPDRHIRSYKVKTVW